VTAVWADRQDWILHAACAGCDPEAWTIPPSGGNQGPSRPILTDENHAAIRVCESCPVRVGCARYALAVYPSGVILAGVPLFRGRRGPRSRDSVKKLHAIVGGVA